MRRFAIALLALGVAVVLAAPARAGAVHLLTPDGNPDLLEDNDWETFAENDGLLNTGGVIDLGEFVVGMFEIDNINGTRVSNSTGTFEGVFAARIATKASGGTFGTLLTGGNTFTLTAPTATEYASLQARYSSLPNRNSANSMLLLYDDHTGNVGVNESSLSGDVNTDLLQALDGDLVAEFGLRDGDELWRLDTDSDVIASINAVAFAAALNVTHNASHVDFGDVPQTIAGDLSDPLQVLPPAEFHINEGSRDETLPRGGFDVGTDANMQVNVTSVVPEPGSLTLLVIGVAGLGAVARRRRTARKAAA